ncbi:MAG: hypothetical protein MUP47_04130 [Phycisphaerae bacterium]|nr:hypothetical protein [Phycisphaerae bacterium]
MQTPDANDQGSCGSSCQSCWARLGLIPPEGLTGWRLVLAAAGAFFSPLLQAILGAVLLPLVWHSPHSRTVGALGGLALGLVDSVFLVWCIKGAGNRRA